MKKKIFIIIVILLVLITGIFLYPRNKENTKWKITQYGDNEGAQMMCFTIEGNKSGLIIIDGGYRDNADQSNFLKTKISENNNTVDYWIITHLDSDHVGQFLTISKLDSISIKKILVQDAPTNIEILKENAPWEDDWQDYEEFMKLDMNNITKVHSGEEYENLIGLKMKVLSSYEEWIDEKTNNLLNNGAVVFKLYGNKESILFTGDIQNKEISDYLIDNYKEELKSDYLQVPHHGNNWVGEEFYKFVNPRIAFFSAPDWLMENTGNVSWFTVKENRKTLEDLGAKIFWHNTSPNVVTLY